MVKKAVVLAAGLGTRLRPLTYASPKPLMPVWGEPMIARIVAMLREWGVDDIVVNCHAMHEQIEAWCKENGCKASYEPEILGTGGVLNPLRDWIGQDEFYLVNSDIVMENVPSLSECVDEGDNVMGWCLVTEEGPRTIEVEPESGFVTNWNSDDAGWDGTYTYSGVARLKSSFLDYVVPEGASSLVSAYEKAMMDGRFMKAIRSDEFLWSDAGTIDSYIDLNQSGEDNAFECFPQLKATGAKEFKFLGARGSDRMFFRCERGIAIIYDDTKRGENARYASHARWLAGHGIPVPSVIEDLPAIKTLLLEDGGVDRKMTLEEYVKVVEMLAAFGSLDATSLEMEPEFNAELLKWEHDLFVEHCLGTRFHVAMTEPVAKELAQVSSILEKEPKALVHRDFQSTNILWRKDRFVFIDFQGMRLGPAAYDLASLLYDPYVKFTEGERRALVSLYARKVGREDIVKVFSFAAVQRLIQCLGAYGRLASVGQPQFGKFVLPALENLLDAADRAGLDAIGALAEDLIAMESKSAKSHTHEHSCNCGGHDGHDHVCTCGHHHHK